MNIKLLKTFIFCIGLSAAGLAWSQASTGTLSARVDRDQIGLGETFSLQIEYSGKASGGAPDLSTLRTDFDVLGTSQRQQTSIVNGYRTSSMIWTSTLAPKQKGNLQIPAFTLHQVNSNPISITVTEQSAVAAGMASSGLSVEATLEDKPVYVQGELLYTLKLQLPAGSTDISLGEPMASDVQFTQHGEDKTQRVAVGGQEYHLYERNYLVRPQRSGKIDIPPVMAQIRLRDGQNRSPFSSFGGSALPDIFAQSGFGSSIFDQMMNPGRAVTVRSNAVTIDVLPQPQSSSGWFLPAKQVQITDSWLPENPQFRVGEAVTRKIQLMALGATAEQLPDIALTEVEGVRIYRDGTEDKTVPMGSGMASVREYTVTVLPTSEGEITLPSIDFTWWDVTEEIEKTASLDSKTITVLPALSSAGVVPVSQAKPVTDTTTANDNSSIDAVSATLPSSLTDRLFSRAGVAAIGLVLGAIGLTFWLWRWLHSRRQRNVMAVSENTQTGPNTKKDTSKQLNHEIRTAAKAVRTACQANDNSAAYAAMNRWCSARFPARDGNALAFFQRSAEGLPMSGLIDELVANTYSAQSGNWDGTQFYNAFRKVQPELSSTKAESISDQILPALYPTSTTSAV